MNIVEPNNPLTPAINHLIDKALQDVHTVYTGKVKSFDGYAAQVELTHKDMPILLDVPICFYGTGSITIRHKIEKGTSGLVLICSRDAYQFIDEAKPLDRKFNLSDAFFIPIAQPRAQAIQAENDGVYIQNGDSHIHLKDNGECLIQCLKVKTTEIECDKAVIGGIDFATHSHDASTVLDSTGKPCAGQVGVPS